METFSAVLAFFEGNSPFTGNKNSHHRGQWRGALMFSLTYTWTNGWINNRDAGDLRRNCAYCDVISMTLRHMDCLRGGRVVTRGFGGCQSDIHRRLRWRWVVVAMFFVFPCPVELNTDFIAFYNIYFTIRTERNCWNCLDSRYEKILSIVFFNDTSLLDCRELYIILTSYFTITCSLLLGIQLVFYNGYCIMLLNCMLNFMYFVRNDE